MQNYGDIYRMMELFLDANAHVALNPKAAATYLSVAQQHGHPSALNKIGRNAATLIEQSREKIAQLIGANSAHQIFFTSTCTQAIQWGLDIFLKNRNIVSYSAIEHNAVKDYIEHYSSYSNKPVLFTKRIPDLDGGFTTFIENEFVSSGVPEICCTMQNELGNIYETALFSDMSQALGKVAVSVEKAEVAAFGAHKFGGPAVGFFYLKDPSSWRSFGSGSRYFMDRPGTPDVPGIAATAVALEEAINSLESRNEKMHEFQDEIEGYFSKVGLEVIGSKLYRSPNTTFVHIPDQAARIILELEKSGIYLGLGSACGSMTAGPSPLIKALGRTGNAHDYLRISQWGEYGRTEAKLFIKAFEQAWR